MLFQHVIFFDVPLSAFIFNFFQRLKTVVKREAEVKMQMISQRYEMKAQEMYNKSVMAELVEEQKRRKEQEWLRLQDIEKVFYRVKEIAIWF